MAKVNITPVRTKFQKFFTQEIARSEIKNAPYNPRRISDDARARLKAKIEGVGLVNVLVWNKRNGNLVSGHQRLSILDELEGGRDYTLIVSVVDVDEKTERELNVFVNNAGAQGDWDLTALRSLSTEFADDLAGLGFAAGELDFLDGPKADDDEPDPKGGGGGKPPRETQDGTQVVVVFRDAAGVDDFLRFIGQPLSSRYCDGVKAFAAHGFTPKGAK